MSSSFEKSVKGGTKIKLAAPKAKYVEHILLATRSGEAGVAEVFRTMEFRIRDSTWTIVFKALIIVHLMIREGEPNVTLKFIADSPRKLAISSFSDVQAQGANIRRYSEYLLERARAYHDCKIDFVHAGQGRLKRLTVEKGLLRETESVQRQIRALVRCELLTAEPENEITLTAFRLLTMDLLVLYSVMNEGTINVLEHYFEMSKVDAERSLNIYKTFSKQTEAVVGFLQVAREYETATRLEIPKLKHAPTSLTSSLQEYLNDPDFEINRRQYLAQQEAKTGGRGTSAPSRVFEEKPKTADRPSVSQSFPATKAQIAAKPEAKGPPPDLIDFFESIEQSQQVMGQQPPPQFASPAPLQQPFQTTQAFQSQSSFPQAQQYGNPFGQPNGMQFQAQQPVQPTFTGAGFGGYTPQQQQPQPQHAQQQPNFHTPLSSIPQNGVAGFPQQSTGGQQQQSTNPFRQSIMTHDTGSTAQSVFASPITSSPSVRQSTNPFAKNLPAQDTDQFQTGIFPSQAPATPQEQPQPLQPQRTGTNPFARNVTPTDAAQTPPTPLMPNPTGSTNPFRQSQFVNQQTGHGWQTSQGTIGGFESLETVPIFPRPGQS